MAVEITKKKTGNGWDTYEGVVDGKKVSIDVTRAELENMNDRKLETYIKQGLRAAKDWEENKDGGAFDPRR